MDKILLEISRGVWAITHEYANAHLPQLQAILSGTGFPKRQENVSEDPLFIPGFRFAVPTTNGGFLLSEYGLTYAPEDAPIGSVAILDIAQVITKYDQACGPTGMLTKVDLIQRAAANPNIKAILIVGDSGGGESYAAQYASAAVTAAAKIKPVISFVSDLAASAMYYIMSGSSLILANSKIAWVGSIGTLMSITDFRDYFAKEGIRFIDIYADESTEKNADHKAALEGNLAPIKSLINPINDQFLNDVQQNRAEKLKASRDEWGKGKLFMAEKALEMGLIDGIMTMEETLKMLVNQ